MSYVKLYTLSTSHVHVRTGDYVMFTRFPVHSGNSLVHLSGDYSKMVEVPEEKLACKVYRLCETGKPDKLVAIDPELADTIEFLALTKVKEQLADGKLRVNELTDKLSVAELLLTKEKANSLYHESKYNKLRNYIDTMPGWKFVWIKLSNWFNK